MYKDSSCRSSSPTSTTTRATTNNDEAEIAATTIATTIVATSHTQETPRTTLTASLADAEEDDAFSCPSESSSDADDDDAAVDDTEYHTRSRPSTTSTNSTNSTSSTSASLGGTVSAVACRAASNVFGNATSNVAPIRRTATAPRLDVNTDVRLLRKIGYIATRVRFLAQLYGDFKLVNPYSPAKQRRQLQEILLHHSIIDPARELAKIATDKPPASPAASSVYRSLTPSSSSSVSSSSYCCLPQHESPSSLCGGGAGNDDETAATTSTADGTVRRRSSGVSAATAASILLLEDLLVQFYEDRHRNKLTVIRRRRSRRSSSSGGGGVGGGVGVVGAASAFTAATATATTANGNRQSHLFIMSGKTASAAAAAAMVASTSSVERLLLATNDNETPDGGAVDDLGAELLPQRFLNANTSNASGATSASSSQAQFHQLLQRQAAAATFLQPNSGGGGGDDNTRRRRASDCSTHAGQQLLSQQLQVTLKNNNCAAVAKFPFHRGSCGAAGEHLLAANSIANRSTIILSKSCSNVDGSASNAAALYASSDLRNMSGAAAAAAGGAATAVGGGGTATPSGSGIAASTNGNNEYSIVQLNNTIIQCHFNDDDFRALVKDLKRKVEYTERMNWLCLSKRPMGPAHRKSSLPKHQEVKRRFLEICDSTFSEEVKAALRLPAFDSYEWGDADVIHLMQTMFIELGFIDKFQLPVETLREWLYEVYKHYNEVPFHNFRHCFCVAQMMYAITRQANLLQRLGDLECLILLVSCICHDLDHPGYNNIYQINARTELALRYNDISPLENHHCSIAFRLLEHPECNIFKNFSRDTFNQIREGIIRCILATDMARHNEILTQFKEVTPIFDYSNRAHINLLCMILIKVADISNEARPMDVAEPWLDRLLQEFFAQSAAEKSEGLPVTPFMDPDKVSKPGSQVRFIGLVLLPLFEALGDLVPEVIELIIIPVRVALDYYKRLNDAQSKSRKSVADSSGSAAASENNSGASDGAAATSGGGAASSTGGGGGGNSGGSISPQMPRSQSGISVKSRRSIPSQKSASRTSVDEPQCIAAELHDLPEGSESGDSETATEVDVAEKTSKFKVDTEGSSNRSKSSHSTSRKSSREKRPSMIGEMCSSGGGQRIRNSYGNIHGYHSNRCQFGSNRAVSLDQYSSNNRRLSDGLQQVISDSNVFYNRQNRGSLETNAAGGSSSGAGGGGGGVCRLIEDMNMNAATGCVIAAQPTHSQMSSSPYIVPNTESGGAAIVVAVGLSGGVALPSAVINSATASAINSTTTTTNQNNTNASSNGNLSPTQPKQHCCAAAAAAAAAAASSASSAANGIATNGAGSAMAGGAKSSTWKARFKQFSDYFSLSFDKSSKRFGSTRSSPCSVRNNNAATTATASSLAGGGGMLLDPLTGKPGGVCCTISNNLQSPGGGGLLRGGPKPPMHQELINAAAGRHRAYSLDVPICGGGGRNSNPRYSSSSGGGGDSSRKSSRHDCGISVAHSGDDNNSNNTLHSCGGAGSEMPTCLPPPIRIGSVDASDTILITTAGLQRVITPAQLGVAAGVGGGEAEPSLSIDFGMATSGSSSAEPPKI